MPTSGRPVNTPAKEQIMLQAVSAARKGRGFVAPNPCVGAVLTLDGRIVASGYHQRYGGDHAEVEVINTARKMGIDLKQTVLWVTLEPCNHTGKTPPCTRAILEAGIPRVVVGTRDPNPGVKGGGVEFLRSGSVEVETGVAEQACRDLIRDFLVRRTRHRPFVILKLASTLDGKIGTRNSDSFWITGPEARREVHRMRAEVNAVLVGGRTFFSDNPGLDCRDAESHRATQPLALVVSSELPREPSDFNLLRQRPEQTIFLTSSAAAGSRQAEKLKSMGVEILPLPSLKTGLDLLSGMKDLYRKRDCYTILCEGGGRLAGSLLEQELVDEFHLFLAPKVLGDEQGIDSVSGRNALQMSETVNFRLADQKRIGLDLWLTLYPES
ncbi:MAG: bifunctional diaminohydroxyphosphoribosylaminopyrimidine deaminase/5-amino-6-(5-phosphoribosylamino)uracil reductase RibD [Desulfohalobiaceae bacterium]|nr:bifunctional diaminohydroxyphosphoribosylaminopyrimidine deaminase/5-amino-6-(5-phosphoribosylamino)uracil reductase RibD [Desulfohalobiaceae bacterium]